MISNWITTHKNLQRIPTFKKLFKLFAISYVLHVNFHGRIKLPKVPRLSYIYVFGNMLGTQECRYNWEYAVYISFYNYVISFILNRNIEMHKSTDMVLYLSVGKYVDTSVQLHLSQLVIVNCGLYAHIHFYPRPVLAFGYCHCLRLCVYMCVRVSVCLSACVSITCPCDNLGPVQARITKFGSNMQKILV